MNYESWYRKHVVSWALMYSIRVVCFRSNEASTIFTMSYNIKTFCSCWCTQLVIRSQLFFFLVFPSSHDWKARLKLPPVDTRYRTEVWLWMIWLHACFELSLAFLTLNYLSWASLKALVCAICSSTCSLALKLYLNHHLKSLSKCFSF